MDAEIQVNQGYGHGIKQASAMVMLITIAGRMLIPDTAQRCFGSRKKRV